MRKIEYAKGEFIELDRNVIKGPNGQKTLSKLEYLIFDKMLSVGNKRIVLYTTFMVEIWNYDNSQLSKDDIKAFKTNQFNSCLSDLRKSIKKIAPNVNAKEFLKRDNLLGCSCNYVSLQHIENCSINQTQLFEASSQKIADKYYEDYNVLEQLEHSSRMTQSLMDVFCFPNFANGERFNLSESKKVFICAPNGFGKSTLLRALLFAANPSEKCKERTELVEKIAELKRYYNIEKDHLTIFADLKKVNDENDFKSAENLYQWLLYVSGLEDVLNLQDFTELITYYNQNNRLLLIFDSLDEVVQKREMDISREDVLTKIRVLTSADGICNNAKVVIASRPLVYSPKNRKYTYLYIQSLISDLKSVETIIEKYAPNDKEKLLQAIYGDPYLKHFIVTPQLLIDVISRILLNKSEDTGDIYTLIRKVIRVTMMRFLHKENLNYNEKNYEHIYEIFSYVSLFHSVENKTDDFAEIEALILNQELNYQEKHKKPIEAKDVKDAYEHFCLFNTQGQNLEFLAPKVLDPYYLACYMYKFCKMIEADDKTEDKTKVWEEYGAILNHQCQIEIWKKFDTILNNRYKKDEYLYDMLVFFFGIIHDGLTPNQAWDPYSVEYRVWVGYVVHKWDSLKDCETEKEKFKARLKYLLDSNFVKDSCLETILNLDEDLSESEQQLKCILNELK